MGLGEARFSIDKILDSPCSHIDQGVEEDDDDQENPQPRLYVWRPQLCVENDVPQHARLDTCQGNVADDFGSDLDDEEDDSFATHEPTSCEQPDCHADLKPLPTLMNSLEQTLSYQYRDPTNLKRTFFFKCMSKPKRNRTTYSTLQLIHLERIFRTNQYVVGQERKHLAHYLDLSETQIKVWFQNRRTKDRKSRIDDLVLEPNRCIDANNNSSSSSNLVAATNTTTNNPNPSHLNSGSNATFFLNSSGLPFH